MQRFSQHHQPRYEIGIKFERWYWTLGGEEWLGIWPSFEESSTGSLKQFTASMLYSIWPTYLDKAHHSLPWALASPQVSGAKNGAFPVSSQSHNCPSHTRPKTAWAYDWMGNIYGGWKATIITEKFIFAWKVAYREPPEYPLTGARPIQEWLTVLRALVLTSYG